VGSRHKIEACKALGADVVIDKSNQQLWAAAEAASPKGYIAVFDANGVATLGDSDPTVRCLLLTAPWLAGDSYQHLAMCGRLIVYGFHSNLPMGSSMLNPLAWARMAVGMFSMPKFDSMQATFRSMCP
jgi:NADPH-dependent curcumin reductase CurA